jgi:rhodanese-related sulfurtransferase
VLPTHGSGSFCAAGPIVSDRVTTLGAQRRRNPLLALAEEPAFAATLLAGLGEYPAYYRSMAPINRAGPPVLGGVPVPATIAPDDVERRVGAGAWIVDARARTTFAAAHIPGSLNIELGDTFAAYVGWLAPFDAPLVLVVPEPTGEATIEAATQLHRIGFDHVRGVLRGGIDAWAATGRPLAAYPTVTAGEVVDAEGRGESVELLDVRQPIEWRDEGAVPGARRIFVGDLPGRLDELPRDRPITVLCRSGQRAAIAASILDRAGIEVRLVAEGGAPAWQRAARHRRRRGRAAADAPTRVSRGERHPGPPSLVPGRDRARRLRALQPGPAARGARDGLAPAGWHQAGRQVGERSEDEQSLCRSRVRHDEQPAVGPPDCGRIERPTRRRPLDRQSMATEHQKVEVELARAPATSSATTERALHALERHEQRDRPGRRIRPGRHLEGHCRIAEGRLVRHADRGRHIEPRHPAQPDARERRHDDDRGAERGLGVTEIRPEADVRPDPSVGHCRRRR